MPSVVSTGSPSDACSNTHAHLIRLKTPQPQAADQAHTQKPQVPAFELTSLDLRLVLDAVVGLAAAQEVLAAAGGLDVLNAHVDALADDAAVHLGGRNTSICCSF